MERTLVLVKPDAMQRGVAAEILSRLERRGLKLVGLKLMQVSDALAREHYGEHEGKSFFEGLIAYITASPIIAAVFEGTSAIQATRSTLGKTNPAVAEPGTVRGDLGLETGRNLVHGSDSGESAAREIALFFPDAELFTYPREVDRWIFE